jgi:hypothetical protein
MASIGNEKENTSARWQRYFTLAINFTDAQPG